MNLNMNDRLTSYELARRAGGEAPMIVELLNMSNEMTLDTPNIACNKGEVHAVLLRDTYPKAEVTGYNRGVGSAASQTRTEFEGLMKMATYSIVDQSLAQASGNEAKVYSDEAQAFVMGMGVQIAEKMIYGSKAANPYEINGLATRLGNIGNSHVVPLVPSVTPDDKPTSIYLCAAGAKMFHLLHSATNGSIGVKRTDYGIENRNLGDNKFLPCHVDYFTAEWGLAIEHPDAVWRICNIPTTGAKLTPDLRKDLVAKILHCQKMLPLGTTTAVIYGNITSEEIIEQTARDMQVYVHPDKDPWSNPVNTINGMRIRRMDVIKCGEPEEIVTGPNRGFVPEFSTSPLFTPPATGRRRGRPASEEPPIGDVPPTDEPPAGEGQEAAE